MLGCLQAGGYSAMQAVWLELMRMLPELAFDAFNQQLLRTLQLKWEQRKLCEPGNQLEPTQWLQSMPKWAAQMLLLHGHKAGGCLRPLMQVGSPRRLAQLGTLGHYPSG